MISIAFSVAIIINGLYRFLYWYIIRGKSFAEIPESTLTKLITGELITGRNRETLSGTVSLQVFNERADEGVNSVDNAAVLSIGSQSSDANPFRQIKDLQMQIVHLKRQAAEQKKHDAEELLRLKEYYEDELRRVGGKNQRTETNFNPLQN